MAAQPKKYMQLWRMVTSTNIRWEKEKIEQTPTTKDREALTAGVDLHRITGAEVKVDIIPMWEKGVCRDYA